jgi:hypothetical protein
MLCQVPRFGGRFRGAVAWYAAVGQPLIVFIGVCEVLGGIGLILPAITRVKPKLTPLAAAGPALTMVLAAGFHIMRGEHALVPANIVAGVAAFIAVGRSSHRTIAPAPAHDPACAHVARGARG